MQEYNNLEELLLAYPIDASYYNYSIKKQDGGIRPIVSPNEPMKVWLRKVLITLNSMRKDWPEPIHGGIQKRSYVSFVRPHIDKNIVITLDIHNCFGSITQKMVCDSLIKKLNINNALAKNLSSKLCVNGKIPQGYSTSNFLTNIYLNDTVLNIRSLLLPKKVNITVYIDDIALSGNKFNCSEVINLVCNELSKAKLSIKKAKVKVMHSHMRQIITSLVINKTISLTKEKQKEIFSMVANNKMSEESLNGWLSNLNMFNKTLMKKLSIFAIKKGYTIHPKKNEKI